MKKDNAILCQLILHYNHCRSKKIDKAQYEKVEHALTQDTLNVNQEICYFFKASMTVFGACTNSIKTPQPEIGDSTSPLGWMKVTSYPAAPFRIPPGVNLTPLDFIHSTALGKSSTQSPI